MPTSNNAPAPRRSRRWSPLFMSIGQLNEPAPTATQPSAPFAASSSSVPGARVVRPHVGLEQRATRGLGVVEQLGAVGGRHRERLLAQHVLAGVERAVDPLGVQVVGQRVVHRVDVVAARASRRTARTTSPSRLGSATTACAGCGRTPAAGSCGRCGWTPPSTPHRNVRTHDDNDHHSDLGHLLDAETPAPHACCRCRAGRRTAAGRRATWAPR